MQWPARDVCAPCHTGGGGGAGNDDWNEDEVFKYLVGYFHGLGAPRPRPVAVSAADAAGEGGGGAPPSSEGESLKGYWKVESHWENRGGGGGGGGGWGIASSPVFIGVSVAAVPLVAVVALVAVGSTGGKTFNGYWTRHINKTRAAFRRRSGGGSGGSRGGSPPFGGVGGGGESPGSGRRDPYSRLL